MKQKFYSELTHKYYDTMEEGEKAEKELHEAQVKAELEKKKAEEAEAAKKAERKSRADEVSNARKAMQEARKTAAEAEHAYFEVLQAFCHDFGPYHATYTKDDMDADAVIQAIRDELKSLCWF